MLSTITTLKAETPENEDTKRDKCGSKLHGKQETQHLTTMRQW